MVFALKTELAKGSADLWRVVWVLRFGEEFFGHGIIEEREIRQDVKTGRLSIDKSVMNHASEPLEACRAACTLANKQACRRRREQQY